MTLPEVAPDYLFAATAAASVVAIVLLVLWSRAQARLRTITDNLNQVQTGLADIEKRYKPVIDLDHAIADRTRTLDGLNKDTDQLRSDYARKREVYDALSHEVRTLEGRLDLAELGMYEPQLSLDSSGAYAEALSANLDKQKQMISAGTAAVCQTTWTVNGSQRAGATMASRAIRLALRAFNNECEVVCSKVTWKNFEASKTRIAKSRDAINKLNQSQNVALADRYLELKHEQLRLTHEERLKKQQELEAIRAERARIREEERAQREIEAEIRRAEKDEELQRAALEKATAQLEAATGAERARLSNRIADLEAKLAEAQAARNRAVSMAQQTRIGHVYVISNIGSFGERVLKVGMTRRIDPMERIQELGDASVPFPFDVHALVFTEDAPGLERELQQALDQYRVNRVNFRKEFFKVDVGFIKTLVTGKFPHVPFIDQPDAREYYGSLPKPAIQEIAHIQQQEQFPLTI